MEALDLCLPDSLLTGPFTRPMAAAVGVARPALERMIAAGVVRRVLRGVYAGVDQPDDVPSRVAALALVVAPGAVVVDRTAAWCHGIWLSAQPPARLDVLGRRGSGHFAARRVLRPEDVVTSAGVRVTSPLRTVADLGRLLSPDRALAVLDAALRAGLVEAPALLAEMPRWTGLPGGRRLLRTVPLGDGRARDAAESVLRSRWLDAGLPTPVPGLAVPHGRGCVRVALGLPEERFAATIAVVSDGPAAPAPEGPGWHVLRLSRARVLGSDAELVQQHLSRRFQQHLLRMVG